MRTTENHPSPACQAGCTDIVGERNRYYTGRYLAARDFSAEQEFMLSKQRTHNRMLHGWGIVCGLEVKHHTQADCHKRWVTISAGYAIDCCGRELALPRNIAFELPLPTAAGNPAVQQLHEPFILGLEYCETLIDYVPVLYAENACDNRRNEANRTREWAQIVTVEQHKVSETCWPRTYLFRLNEKFAAELGKGTTVADDLRAEFASHGITLSGQASVTIERVGQEWNLESDKDRYVIRRTEDHLQVNRVQQTPCLDDCDSDNVSGGCLDANCACGGIVPLAWVVFDAGKPEDGFHLDRSGRRYVKPASELLTHIVHINWPHGGELSLRKVSHELKGELRIRFDRKLLTLPAGADGNPVVDYTRGLNLQTFVVQYRGTTKNLEFLPFPHQHPPRFDEQTCEAVYTIDPGFLDDTDAHEDNIAGYWVNVTLRCDFILDCHHQPVDGNFLRAHLPTGDGVPGGAFESWFRVTTDLDDDAERRLQRERRRSGRS